MMVVNLDPPVNASVPPKSWDLCLTVIVKVMGAYLRRLHTISVTKISAASPITTRAFAVGVVAATLKLSLSAIRFVRKKN